MSLYSTLAELGAYMEAQREFVREKYGECNDQTLAAFVRSGESEAFRKSYEEEQTKEN